MQLLLTDLNPAMCGAWEDAFKGMPDVSIHNSRFEELKEFDCVSCAGNSFGVLDGGMDLSVRCFFGARIEEVIQDKIHKLYAGEQPVGTSFLVDTINPDHPWVAHTPTMRHPMRVSETLNAYHAMMGLLTALRERDLSVVVPGFCVLTGGMDYTTSALQMACAYRNFLGNQKRPKRTWGDFT